MNIIESLQWRYATKKFDPNKKLTESQLNIFKEAFNLTATSYGLQPIKMIVIQNKTLQEKLVPHSMNQQQVGDASHLLVLCVENQTTEADIEAYFDNVQSLRNTPDEIIDPFKNYLKTSFVSKPKEVLFQWAKNQAYLALGNLMTVAAIEQVDACPMEGFDAAKFDEILGLQEQNLSSVLLLPIGYRADDCFMKDLKKVRKKTSDIIIDIH